MTTITKRILIACLCALPTFAFATDKPAEVTVAAPQPTAVPAPTEALLKPVAVQSARIGFVDIARIGTESERGKALRIMLNAKKDQLQSTFESKKKQLDKLKASIEATIAKLTPQQREAKSKEFQKKLEELQKLAQASEGELNALQDKESTSLFEAIERSAVAHGKANAFTAIIIKKELLYASTAVDAHDVTDALIKALNQSDQKK
jgi:outer membrane protein